MHIIIPMNKSNARTTIIIRMWPWSRECVKWRRNDSLDIARNLLSLKSEMTVNIKRGNQNLLFRNPKICFSTAILIKLYRHISKIGTFDRMRYLKTVSLRFISTRYTRRRRKFGVGVDTGLCVDIYMFRDFWKMQKNIKYALSHRGRCKKWEFPYVTIPSI